MQTDCLRNDEHSMESNTKQKSLVTSDVTGKKKSFSMVHKSRYYASSCYIKVERDLFSGKLLVVAQHEAIDRITVTYSNTPPSVSFQNINGLNFLFYTGYHDSCVGVFFQMIVSCQLTGQNNAPAFFHVDNKAFTLHLSKY